MDGKQTYHAPADRRGPTFALVVALWLVGAIAVSWLRWRPFRVEVEGDSMGPTLAPGDWLVATRRGRIGRGSIVVVEHPSRPGFELVKRIAATAGERRPGNEGTVEPEAFWVEGDRPDASTDSRTFGPVRRAAIRGVVRFRYGPLGRIGRVDTHAFGAHAAGAPRSSRRRPFRGTSR